MDSSPSYKQVKGPDSATKRSPAPDPSPLFIQLVLFRLLYVE